LSDDTQKAMQRGDAQDAPPRPRMPAGKRRALAWGGAVLVVLLLVAVPALIATQPSFMTRYSYLSTQTSTLSQSKHKDVSCQQCHVRPDLLSQAAFDLRMAGAFYVSLISPSTRLGALDKPTTEACESCHTTLVTTSPAGDLKIPHRAHVDVLKVPCVQCHQYLVHELSPEGKHTPTMAACLKCHDGTQAKNACETCHTKKAAPASHSAPDWLVVHPTMVSKIDCASCHAWTKNWCADCHQRRPPSHTATWRVDHAAAVKVHRDCEVCHTGSFCITCHGDVPKLNFNPALTLVK
jgi:hypothetical protein